MYVASVKWVFQVMGAEKRRLWLEGVEAKMELMVRTSADGLHALIRSPRRLRNDAIHILGLIMACL